MSRCVCRAYLDMMVTQADKADPARAKTMPRMSTEVSSDWSIAVAASVTFSPPWLVESEDSGNRAGGLEIMTTPTVRMSPIMLL